MSNIFVFPGQGAQVVGMGAELYKSNATARAVFDEVNEALGEKLSDIIFNGPMDELTYPRDVRRFLKQKYNNTFDFDKLKLPADAPVYFGGVREIEELGDINPNTGDRTTYTRRYVECRTLNDKDIVVDKNLLKLFPVSANLLPWTIINFFNTQINIH